MLNTLIFIILPYVALTLALTVVPYRLRYGKLRWSAHSTQFLENQALYWGSNPWHYGIIPILAAHLFGVLFPAATARLVGDGTRLLIIEATGLGLGFLALAGILILLLRRANSPMLGKVTSPADWLVLLLLIIQTATGVAVAIVNRWGAQWYPTTAGPYLRSLLLFNPQPEYVSGISTIFTLHVAGAFLLLAVLPFTKLVHLLYLPLDFLKDKPIPYRWHVASDVEQDRPACRKE